MEIDELQKSFARIEKDDRLNVWHFSLLCALFFLAFKQQKIKNISISRIRIMSLSHIKTIPSYHKYLKELQYLGYIAYFPSYHPASKSTLDLII